MSIKTLIKCFKGNFHQMCIYKKKITGIVGSRWLNTWINKKIFNEKRNFEPTWRHGGFWVFFLTVSDSWYPVGASTPSVLSLRWRFSWQVERRALIFIIFMIYCMLMFVCVCDLSRSRLTACPHWSDLPPLPQTHTFYLPVLTCSMCVKNNLKHLANELLSYY